MQAYTTDRNVRVFAAAISFLAKVGKEISFECLADKIILRTLNDARSSFAAVHFERDFFVEYTPPEATIDEEVKMKCRVSAKSAVQVFKSLRNANAMRLYFAQQEGTHFLVIQFQCKHDVTRTHSLYYEDADIFQAVFDRASVPNKIIMRPALFARLCDNIRGTEEMSLLATQSLVTFQSYHTSAESSSVHGALHTAMTVPAYEFDSFVIDGSTNAAISETMMPSTQEELAGPKYNITYSLKELKALLAFCEDKSVISEEIAALFVGHGYPVLFSTEGAIPRPFKADLIMATLQRPVDRIVSAGAGPTTTTTAAAVPAVSGAKRGRGE